MTLALWIIAAPIIFVVGLMLLSYTAIAFLTVFNFIRGMLFYPKFRAAFRYHFEGHEDSNVWRFIASVWMADWRSLA